MNIVAVDSKQAAVLWQSGREEDGNRVNEVRKLLIFRSIQFTLLITSKVVWLHVYFPNALIPIVIIPTTTLSRTLISQIP